MQCIRLEQLLIIKSNKQLVTKSWQNFMHKLKIVSFMANHYKSLFLICYESPQKVELNAQL